MNKLQYVHDQIILRVSPDKFVEKFKAWSKRFREENKIEEKTTWYFQKPPMSLKDKKRLIEIANIFNHGLSPVEKAEINEIVTKVKNPDTCRFCESLDIKPQICYKCNHYFKDD